MSVGINVKEQTASYIVGVDGSTYYAINCKTGIVTTNASASTLIQACINALTTGGTIFLKAGTYPMGTQTNLSNNIRLVGEGSNSILQLSATVVMFYATTKSNIEFRNLTFDQNGNDNALLLFEGCTNVNFDSCVFSNAGAETVTYRLIYFQGNGEYLKINGCTFSGNYNHTMMIKQVSYFWVTKNIFKDLPKAKYVILVDSANNGTINENIFENVASTATYTGNTISVIDSVASSTDITINDNLFNAIGLSAGDYGCIHTRADRITIDGNKIYNVQNTLDLAEGHLVTVTNNIIEDADKPIFLGGEDNVHNTYYTFNNNTLKDTCKTYTFGGHSMAVLSFAQYVVAIGNTIYDSGTNTEYGFYGTSGSTIACNYWYAVHNRFEGVIGFYSMGSNSVLKFNKGYVTENSGTSSVLSGATIAHGCVGTPKVQITVNEITPIPVSFTVDATNITVYHSAGGNVTVSWRAEV